VFGQNVTEHNPAHRPPAAAPEGSCELAEDMLAFEYDSGWGGQDEDDDDFAEDGGFF
jgi:hypothetical protein